jgi:hypothetical protein
LGFWDNILGFWDKILGFWDKITKLARSRMYTLLATPGDISTLAALVAVVVDLPQVSLEWVSTGYIQFIMRSVLNLKRRTRETCKTRRTLLFTGNNDKISRGEGKRGCIENTAKMRITTDNWDKYVNYRKKGYWFWEIGH